jgi:hypothetical protein
MRRSRPTDACRIVCYIGWVHKIYAGRCGDAGCEILVALMGVGRSIRHHYCVLPVAANVIGDRSRWKPILSGPPADEVLFVGMFGYSFFATSPQAGLGWVLLGTVVHGIIRLKIKPLVL